MTLWATLREMNRMICVGLASSSRSFAGRFRLMQEGDKDGVVELMKDAMQ